MAKQRAMGTELEAFNAAKKYNKTPSERAKQMAYERVSYSMYIMHVSCIQINI